MDSREIKISVIVPVYKVENYLKHCVDSLIKQTFPDIEIILVDDGSPDMCPKICDMYAKMDKRVAVIHQENLGLPAARNSGLKIAKGDWILFLDSDDWLSLDALSCLMAVQDASLDIIFFGFQKATKYYVESRASGSAAQIPLDICDFQKLFQDALSPAHEHCRKFSNGKVTAWTKLYNHNFLKKYNISFYENVKIHEDIPFAMQVFSKAKKGIYLDKNIYFYRSAMGSITNSYRKNYTAELQELIEQIMVLSEKPYCESDIQQLLNERFCSLLVYNLQRNFCNPENPHSYSNRKHMIVSY